MRILVIKLSSLGDVVQALPTIHALRNGWPDARVDWATQPEYATLVEACPDVEEVIRFPRRGFIRHAPDFIKRLRQTRYDMVVDLQGLMKSAIVARLANAGERVGPAYQREGASLLYHRVLGDPGHAGHSVDAMLRVAADLLPDPPPAPEFPLDLPASPPANSKGAIVVCPVSRWDTKNWLPDRFATVIRSLAHEDGHRVILVGGKADRCATERIREMAASSVENLTGRTSLLELAAVLQNAALLITNDSGPMHVAAALGTPVLALFGPTDPARTGPYGPRHRVLTAPCACRPCFRRTCPHDRYCMTAITAEMVMDAARQMLAHSPNSRIPMPRQTEVQAY